MYPTVKEEQAPEVVAQEGPVEEEEQSEAESETPSEAPSEPILNWLNVSLLNFSLHLATVVKKFLQIFFGSGRPFASRSCRAP